MLDKKKDCSFLDIQVALVFINENVLEFVVTACLFVFTVLFEAVSVLTDDGPLTTSITNCSDVNLLYVFALGSK